MGDAKSIVVKPITASEARACVKLNHYSGKVTANSQLNLGVFWNGSLEGAMQFGPPMDRRKVLGLVSGTRWNGMLELNRMAFSDRLPRNSESRALGIVFRMLRKRRPDIEWILSFSDATQCGDGAIYRASGFVLCGVRKNKAIVEFPDGTRVCRKTLTQPTYKSTKALAHKYGIEIGNAASEKPFLAVGAKYLPGYQFRYVYFLNPEARARLTVDVLPFSVIDTVGGRMYKGHAPKA